jgi:hypothetical protein
LRELEKADQVRRSGNYGRDCIRKEPLVTAARKRTLARRSKMHPRGLGGRVNLIERQRDR